MDEMTPLSAKASLAVSRAELLAAMGYEAVAQTVNSAGDAAVQVIELPHDERTSAAAALGARLSRSLVGRWWRRQPISSVVQLGQPLLETYARRHPGKLVAFGAGAGVLLYVLKPWKLLSAATVVALIVKHSDVSGMISDLLQHSDPPDATDEAASTFRTAREQSALRP